MGRKSPKKSSDELQDRNKMKEIIKPRRSIKENSPLPTRKNLTHSPVRSSSPYQEQSPRSTKRLYPDLQNLSNQSNDENDDDDDQNEKEEEECIIRNRLRHKTPINVDDSIRSQDSNIFLYVAIAVIIALMLYVALKFVPKSKVKTSPSSSTVDCSEFLSLDKKFPNIDQKTLRYLKTGIESVYNRDVKKNSVITFLSTDQDLLNDFIKEVVSVARSCINQVKEPISLTKSDLNKQRFLDDNTLVMKDFRGELEDKKIMIFNNLEEISSKVIPSLHAITDTHNPLVAQSIIYITIKIPQKPQGKPIDFIFEHLNEKWSDLKSNIRKPAITRILDQIILLA